MVRCSWSSPGHSHPQSSAHSPQQRLPPAHILACQPSAVFTSFPPSPNPRHPQPVHDVRAGAGRALHAARPRHQAERGCGDGQLLQWHAWRGHTPAGGCAAGADQCSALRRAGAPRWVSSSDGAAGRWGGEGHLARVLLPSGLPVCTLRVTGWVGSFAARLGGEGPADERRVSLPGSHIVVGCTDKGIAATFTHLMRWSCPPLPFNTQTMQKRRNGMVGHGSSSNNNSSNNSSRSSSLASRHSCSSCGSSNSSSNSGVGSSDRSSLCSRRATRRIDACCWPSSSSHHLWLLGYLLLETTHC